jgi:hypothetical protein
MDRQLPKKSNHSYCDNIWNGTRLMAERIANDISEADKEVYIKLFNLAKTDKNELFKASWEDHLTGGLCLINIFVAFLGVRFYYTGCWITNCMFGFPSLAIRYR